VQELTVKEMGAAVGVLIVAVLLAWMLLKLAFAILL
jgi:hypothetical protein